AADEDNISVACGCCPAEIIDNEGIQLAAGPEHLITILVMRKWVASGPVRQLYHRQLNFAAVELHGFTGIQQCFHKTRHGYHYITAGFVNRSAHTATGSVIDSFHNGAVMGRGTAGRIMVTQPVSAPGQTNLTEHAGQSDQHPGGLFSV